MKKEHTLIVGGTRGTGRALVRVFAAKRHAVSVIGRRLPPESDLQSPQVDYWTVDLVDKKRLTKALKDIVDKNGKLSSLIFCQRYRGQDDPWEGDLQTSLTATKNVIEQLADDFDEMGERAIVVVGSVASGFIAEEQPVGYHVAKAGLAQMVRYFAVLLGPKGIRINSVSPSSILKEESKKFYMDQEELRDLYQRIVPLGRMGTAEEISNVIEFLCSSKSSFITGQNIIVDGGLSLQWHESLSRKLASLTHLPITHQTPKRRK